MTENDFPPIVTHMSKQVGKKNELKVVIPNTSKLYYDFTKEKNNYLNDDNRFQNVTSSYVDHGLLDQHIISIEKNESSITLNLNIEHIQSQLIRIVEDYNRNNQLIFNYTVGHGYVLNIEITNNRYRLDADQIFEDVKYMNNKYITALLALGYKSWFFDYEKFKNDKNIIINKIEMYIREYSYSLTIYDKDVYKKYKKLKKEISERDLDNEYKILDKVLN